MKKLVITTVAAAVLIPFAMWWFSTENQIMRRTNHLMDVLTMTEGAGGPLRQGKVYSMNGMLAPQVTLAIPGIVKANGTFDKQEMESAFSWICQNARRAEFRITEFKDIKIDGGNAKVRFIAEGYLELRAGSRLADGIFDVTIDWKKGGDGWRYPVASLKKDTLR